jgi:hypothetical protein
MSPSVKLFLYNSDISFKLLTKQYVLDCPMLKHSSAKQLSHWDRISCDSDEARLSLYYKCVV